jgi:hypothetical protein
MIDLTPFLLFCVIARGGEKIRSVLASDIQRFDHFAWSFRLTLYVTPQTTDLLVLPTHKARLTFAVGAEAPSQTMLDSPRHISTVQCAPSPR